jgi:hypothetical protein
MKGVFVGFTGLVVVALALASPTLGEDVGYIEYGELCVGILAQCIRYSETVVCMGASPNNTWGELPTLCETGAPVDVGRCRCRRNCDADGEYNVVAEFDRAREKCVGLVGSSCSPDPDCTENASCEPNLRLCQCNEGFVPDSDGLRCEQAGL